MAFGVVSLITMHIIPGLWLFLIGLFLKKSAEREYRSFELQSGLQDLRLRQIMTPPVAVDASVTISEFVNDYVFHYHNRVFPVLKNGRFAGMIDIRSIKHVPLSDWPDTAIGGFLSDPSTYCLLDPNLLATEALLLMTEEYTEAPIVHDGVLLGMLTRSDLFKLVSLKSDLAA
jgi:CBS domain-containing protein